MTTHTLPRGVHIAPMPRLRDGEVGRKVQGGLPPEPYRSANCRLTALQSRNPTRLSKYSKLVRATLTFRTK
jgi:hypothetical protein